MSGAAGGARRRGRGDRSAARDGGRRRFSAAAPWWLALLAAPPVRWTMALAAVTAAVATALAAGSAAFAGAGPPVPPPGAEGRSSELTARLHRAWSALPAGERDPAGGAAGARPAFVNRMLLEESSYLRRHAFDPVDWRPWGEEAFAAAVRLDRPVLLSIGYASCHWCHALQAESFADPELARRINERYVAILVDREERPEVDGVYQAALEAAGGSGGWPLLAWLTPAGAPFFTAGYLPRRDGERGVALGLATLVDRLATTWREDRGRLARGAADLVAAIGGGAAGPAVEAAADAVALDRAVARVLEVADPVAGGLAGAPKFPLALPVRALLRQHRRTGDPRALAVAESTLRALAAGAVRDQVGGGFHRYASDDRWRQPHFEKQLADNARLAMLFLEGFAATGDRAFADVARDTLAFVERELAAAGGGFANALDADSAAAGGALREGWYYAWSDAELAAALAPAERRAWQAVHGWTPLAEAAERGVPYRARTAGAAAPELGLASAELEAALGRARERLRLARQRRPPPARDEAVVVAANGLAISAFARAARLLDEPALAVSAAWAAERLLRQAHVGGRLRRLAGGDGSGVEAVLDDYAFLIGGLLDLHEATGELRWFAAARRLAAELEVGFAEPGRGALRATRRAGETLLAARAPFTDNLQPSGNAAAALALLRLAAWTGEAGPRERAARILAEGAALLGDRPADCGELMVALDFLLDAPPEVVIVTPGERAAAAPFLAELRRRWFPNLVLSVLPEREVASAASTLPLVAGRRAVGGRATAYLCRGFVCQRPTTDPAELGRQLDALRPQRGGGPRARP